jgi:hypothetical protein
MLPHLSYTIPHADFNASEQLDSSKEELDEELDEELGC